ncbi:MAG: hypothetical protein ABEL76_14025 [Bradymonadaceae bacterium]
MANEQQGTGTGVLVGLLAAGFLLRLAIGLYWPNLYWPDETFQSLEPAHWWIFGYGKLTWEFQEGARNWLFPGFLAVVMRATEALGPGSWGYLIGVRSVLAAASLVPAAAAYLWARHEDSVPYGWLAPVVPLVWMDLVYFAPKAFYESFTAHLLVGAIYLVRHDRRSWWRAVTGGILLGLCCVSRIQLAPAALALAAAIPLFADHPHERFSALVTGFAVGFGIGGFLDMVTWGAPFQTVIVNYHSNVIEDQASVYGTAPWTAYFEWMWQVSPAGFALLGVALVAGLFRYPTLAWPALALLAAHSVIGHKEYRFLYPFVVLGAVTLGLGTAALCSRLREERGDWRIAAGAAAATVFAVLAVNGWAAWSFDLKTRGGETSGTNWTRFRGQFAAARYLSTQSDVCGFAFVGAKWADSPGYAHVHWDVPWVKIEDLEQLERRSEHLNAAVVSNWHAGKKAPGSFEKKRCFGTTCLLMRPGGCDPPPDHATFNRTTRLTSQTGGDGGESFEWHCGNGGAVTRLTGSTDAGGGRLKSLRAHCRTLNRNGQTGDEIRPGSAGESSPSLGNSTDEGEFELTCPEGKVAVGLTGRSGALVDRIALLCADVARARGRHPYVARSIESSGAAGGQGGSPFRLKCPRGAVLRGISGRAGKSLDAAGIECQYVDLLLHSAPEPDDADSE